MPLRGLDQAELARRSGIKANSISRYLAGLNMPRPAQLAKLAAALEVEWSELLAEEPAGASQPAGGNLLCLTQTSSTSGMVRLQVDQLLPGDVATQIVALLLQAPGSAAEPETAQTEVTDSRKSATQRARPQPRRGTLADVLLPSAPHEPEHARQILRLDGPPQRPLNGGTRA